jgi:hypothetical protein
MGQISHKHRARIALLAPTPAQTVESFRDSVIKDLQL